MGAKGKTAPTSSAKKGAKAKKKKWSKGKVKEKANHAVYFEPDVYEKMLKEIPTGRIITTSGVVERLRVRGSLARADQGPARQGIDHSGRDSRLAADLHPHCASLQGVRRGFLNLTKSPFIN